MTKFKIKGISLERKGSSTLGGREVWFDRDVLRLNYDRRGESLGVFQGDDKVLVITRDGEYFTSTYADTNHYEDNILRIEKFNPDKEWTLALFDNALGYPYLKRFKFEATARPLRFVGGDEGGRILLLTDKPHAVLEMRFGEADATRPPVTIEADEFIAIKSFKAKGKRLTTWNLAEIVDITPNPSRNRNRLPRRCRKLKQKPVLPKLRVKRLPRQLSPNLRHSFPTNRNNLLFSMTWIRNILLALVATVASMASATDYPELCRIDSAGSRPVSSVYAIEIGGTHDLSTYLSPLFYDGLDVGVSGSWAKAFQRWSDRCMMRFEADVDFHRALNPAGTATMYGLTAYFGWGLSWRKQFLRDWQVTAGPMLDIYGGAMYLARNGNNPVNAMAYAGFDASASLSYNFRMGRVPCTVIDEVRIPTLGAFFCPGYGETYYEIYLGNHRDLAHFWMVG